MKKNNIESTKKLAKITRVLCSIAIIAAAVGTAMLAITVLVAYTVSPEHIKPLQDTNRISILINDNLSVPGSVFTSVEALREFLLGLLGRVASGVAVFIVAAFYLMGVLKSVEAGEPFAAANVTRLRAIGVTLIIGSVVQPFIAAVTMLLATHANLLETKANSMVDFTLLLCGLLVIILSGVFAYGARLQREHDQTV